MCAFSLSDITGYPKSFFFQEGDILAEYLSFRKRENVAQKLITPITAKANIVRLHVQYLAEQLGVKPAYIPAVEASGEATPAHIAKEVRKRWKLKGQVIENVTQVLEEAGIAIASVPFATERLDSRSMLTEG